MTEGSVKLRLATTAIGRRLASTLLVFGRPSRPFSLPLLVAKVAQKPRTTSLAVPRATKPKTDAFAGKAFTVSVFSRLCAYRQQRPPRRALIRRRCEVRVGGAPKWAQPCSSCFSCHSYQKKSRVSFLIPTNKKQSEEMRLHLLCFGTRNRGRTGTDLSVHRILSPACLPIPPFGHTYFSAWSAQK